MRKILLIGGAGYVGSVITEFLLKKGYSIRCLDLFIYKNQSSVIPFLNEANYQFVYGDFCDGRTIEDAANGVNYVLILGGLVGDPITKKYPQESEKINDIGIKNCINLLTNKGIERVIFISTCSNYGLVEGDALADENFDLKPLSLYAKAKVEAEEYLLSLKGKTDFSATILRFATAFGLSPRMRFDLTVSEFVRELSLGKELLVFDAKTWRPYCHVQDFARLIEIVLEAPLDKIDYQVFNAGGEENNFTKQGIVDLILEYLPNSKIVFTENGKDLRNYKVNFSKVKNVLGFEPVYSVRSGIIELLTAINMHLFDYVEENENFYGNYALSLQTLNSHFQNNSN